MRPGALALLASAACMAASLGCSGKRAADDKPAADPKGPGSGSGPGSSPGSGSGSAPARPVVPDQISGTLTLDGKPLAISRCRPGRDDAQSIYLDLVTPSGVLRFVPYVPQLRWSPRPDATAPGAPLDCADLQRSWGGGSRPEDGTTYFRGRLIFSCKGEAGAFAGDVTVDCGNISPLERKLLDENQQKKRDELSHPAPPP